MKLFITLTGMIFVYLIYGLYINQFEVTILSEDLVAEHPKGFFDYRGLTNVQGPDLERLIEAAQTAGLDFVSITELNVFDRPSAFVGYHGNLLVMMDGEYSYLNSRLLNLGATSSRHLKGLGRSQVLFADLLSQERKDPDLGLWILARPANPRYRWSGEYPPGLDGLEVINLNDVWQSAWTQKKWSFLFSSFVYPFHENLALLRLFQAPDEPVQLWDQLSQRRHMIGIAGAGIEGQLRYPSYPTLFSLVRDHVLLRAELTGNPHADLEKLSAAIRQGQLYMSLDLLGNPKGFNAVIHTHEGQTFAMGSELTYSDGLTLDVTLPQKPKVPFDTIVYKNGERVLTSNSQQTEYKLTAPGVYRVMVRVIPTFPLPDGKKWVPWIYTNMFYVGSKAPAGTRTTKPASGGN